MKTMPGVVWGHAVFNISWWYLMLLVSVVTTLAGSTNQYFSDGVGTQAGFKDPSGVVLAADGRLFVADKSYHRIRYLTPNGGTLFFPHDCN